MIIVFALAGVGHAQTDGGINEVTQNPQEAKKEKQSLPMEAASPFSMYKDSYGLFGYSSSALNEPLVFKFQISVKFKMPVAGLYLAYTQRSFMDLLEESAPFIDHYYKPELYYIYTLPEQYAENHWLQSLQIGYRHTSNGEQQAVSQSWDRIYLDAVLRKGGWYVRTSLWVPIFTDLANDVDVTDYWGYGELQVARILNNNMRLSAIARKGTDLTKGNIRVDFTIPFANLFSNLAHGWDQSNLWFQLFHGHGETFIGIEESSTALAVGVGFRPDFELKRSNRR
jgi:phospholipase A1